MRHISSILWDMVYTRDSEERPDKVDNVVSEIARKIGVTPRTIYRWLRGIRGYASRRQLKQCLRAYPDKFFDLNERAHGRSGAPSLPYISDPFGSEVFNRNLPQANLDDFIHWKNLRIGPDDVKFTMGR